MADPFDEDLPPYIDDANTANPFASPLAEEERGSEYINRSSEALNPWFSVWLKPRATIRQIVEMDPTYLVLLLAILGGMAGGFDFEDAAEYGGQIGVRVGYLVGAMIGGAIGGIVGLFLLGWLASITGKWLGGVANSAFVRAALAWSSVPGIWFMPLTLTMAFLWIAFGNSFLNTEQSPIHALVWLGYFLGLMVVGLWQFVISCKMIGEVHEFSAWRGLGAILLAVLLIIAVIGIPVFLVLMLVFGLGS